MGNARVLGPTPGREKPITPGKIGAVSLSKDETIDGNKDFSGDVSVSGNLGVTGAATITGGASVGSLTASGQATFGTGGIDSSTLFYCNFFSAIRGGISLTDAFVIDFTGNRTLALSDTVVRLTSGNATVTIPTANSEGTLFIIKNGGAGTLTLATTGGDTIDGAAPGTIAAGGVARLVFNGTSDWITI